MAAEASKGRGSAPPLQSLSKDIADNLGIDRPTGALVVTVAPVGPAAEAGLKRGDLIAAVDDQGVDDEGA